MFNIINSIIKLITKKVPAMMILIKWFGYKGIKRGTSLVTQWLRTRLPMQGTRVRALVWEDPTYRRATKPMHHNY